MVAPEQGVGRLGAVGLKERLTDPWGIVAAAIVGGLGAAVTAALAPVAVTAVPVGLAIAGTVYGVNVAAGVLAGRGAGGGRGDRLDRPGAALPEPTPGGAADRWRRRADAAVQALRQQTGSVYDPVLRAGVGDVDDHAAAILVDLRRFAGQVTLVEQAAARIDVATLGRERQSISAALRGLPAGPLRAERERALASVADQVAVYERLAGARETLLARMQSTVLGLEGLVARLAELMALHATSDGGTGTTAGRLSALTDDLDGLRAGLVESEELSRRLLAGGSGTPTAPGTP